MGHVSDAFNQTHLDKLRGSNAIGHVRYSTAGEVSILEAQPFLVTCQHGQIAICHNGNLPFASEERKRLERDGAIFSSTSDTEVVLHGVARSRLPVREGFQKFCVKLRRVFDVVPDT
jgi:amidophosphoribosyltransferase